MAHVMLILEYPSLNGGERSLLAVIGGLRRQGYRFTALAPPDGELSEALAAEEVEVLPLHREGTGGVRLPLEAVRRQVQAAIDRRRPDLVHANSLSMSRLCGPVAAESAVPSIGHLRDILKVNATVVADLNRHRLLLAVSHATRDWYVSLGLVAEKTAVLYNGVDLNDFQPRPPRRFLHCQLNLPSDSLLVGAIGQFGMRKGLDVLLRAMAPLVARLPNICLLIVGRRYSQKEEARQYESELQRAAAQEPLAGRVHFLGVRDDVPAILNELCLLVHAARQEPLGRVLLEAAASGTAVVATAVGGTGEIFPGDCSAARLVPAGDVAALSREMGDLLADGPLRLKMARAARRRAEAAFDARQAATMLAGHYAAVLNGESC